MRLLYISELQQDTENGRNGEGAVEAAVGHLGFAVERVGTVEGGEALHRLGVRLGGGRDAECKDGSEDKEGAKHGSEG